MVSERARIRNLKPIAVMAISNTTQLLNLSLINV
jgi:hypothetical protein